jgi:hypothetical protein
VVEPIRQAAALLFPWSMLAPFAVWAALAEDDPHRARPGRLALAWAGTALLLIALSERQRWRYYLPLCPPVALLVAAWSDRLWARSRGPLVAWAGAALVVLGLVASEQYEVLRRDRSIDLRALARETRASESPIFTVDSPDIVFDYYLNRPVIPLTYVSQFERTPGSAFLIASERTAQAAPVSLERVAMARVNGRPFVLMRK